MVRPLSRDHRSVSLPSGLCASGMGFRGPAERPLHRPFMPALRHGTKDAALRFPIGRCEGTLGSAPFRRLAELVGFEDRGTRDCATPKLYRPGLWSSSLELLRRRGSISLVPVPAIGVAFVLLALAGCAPVVAGPGQAPNVPYQNGDPRDTSGMH
jgi:hypothetical protein